MRKIRIGIIGMGNIGSRVAKIAEAFGMDVCYYSTSGTGHCKDYPSLSLDELLTTSDVVSIHAPLNDRTAGLIGEAELSMMKSNIPPHFVPVSPWMQHIQYLYCSHQWQTHR